MTPDTVKGTMTSLANGSSKDDKVGFSGNGLGCHRPEHLPRFSIKGMINMHITHALFTHRHTSVSAAFNFEGNMVPLSTGFSRQEWSRLPFPPRMLKIYLVFNNCLDKT